VTLKTRTIQLQAAQQSRKCADSCPRESTQYTQ